MGAGWTLLLCGQACAVRAAQAGERVCGVANDPLDGTSCSQAGPRRSSKLPWLGAAPNEAKKGSFKRNGDRRLELAWLFLWLQAHAGQREPPNALYHFLESLDNQDVAVALLRMVTSEPVPPANYTARVLQLAEQRGLRLTSTPHRRRRRRRRQTLERGTPRESVGPQWVRRLHSPENFLVVRPRNGVGNRLLATISAAGLALALNRRLVVLWEDPGFGHVMNVVDSEENHVTDDSVRAAASARGVKTLSLVAGWPHFRHSVDEIVCGGTAPLSSPGVLLVEADQFFLPLLQVQDAAGTYRAALQRSLGGGPTGVGGVHTRPTASSENQFADSPETEELAAWSRELLAGLFQLGPRIHRTVELESKRLLDNTSFVLGVHLRTGMYDYEKGLVPDIRVEDVFDCIEAALAVEGQSRADGRGNDANGPVVFLATPSEAVKTRARKRFGAKLRTRHGVVTDRSKSAAEADAVVDMALLSMSDALITSVHSTFGYVAQSLAGAGPYVLTEQEHGDNDSADALMVNRRCRRIRSSAPCFHSGRSLALQAVGSRPPACWANTAERLLRTDDPGSHAWAPCRF